MYFQKKNVSTHTSSSRPQGSGTSNNSEKLTQGMLAETSLNSFKALGNLKRLLRDCQSQNEASV